MIFPDLHCSQTTSYVAHKGGETSDAQLKSGNLTEKKTLSSLTFPLAPPLSKSHGCFISERKNTLLCLWLTFCGLLHLMVYIIGGNPLPQLCASVCIWSADGHDVLLCSVFWAHRCLDVVAWTNGCIFSGLG